MARRLSILRMMGLIFLTLFGVDDDLPLIFVRARLP